ncbi:MAG: hypothetical protein Q9228_006652 [Teloschistes exilis]
MLRIFCFAFIAVSVIAIPIEETSLVSNPLYERQIVTDGGPQGPAFHHQQVTDNLACGSASCSVSKLKEHTFGIEGGIEGFDVKDVPVPLAFDVTESWTSGETFQCNADSGIICVWLNVAYTKFNTRLDGNACPKDSHPGQIQFPNKENAGGGYYCVQGDACRSMDANYWE